MGSELAASWPPGREGTWEGLSGSQQTLWWLLVAVSSLGCLRLQRRAQGGSHALQRKQQGPGPGESDVPRWLLSQLRAQASQVQMPTVVTVTYAGWYLLGSRQCAQRLLVLSVSLVPPADL